MHVTCSYCGTALLIGGQGARPAAAASTPAPVVAVRVAPAANVSAAFGLLAWFVLPFIGALIAVIFGYAARRDIAASRGQLSGESRALLGLALGYAQLALAALAIVGRLISTGLR